MKAQKLGSEGVNLVVWSMVVELSMIKTSYEILKELIQI